MTAALQLLTIPPDYLLIDAMQLDVLIEQKSLIKGDARSISIAAASILAKTHRDTRMEEWDAIYPQYGLARHKCYATPDHLEALRQHGPSPLHRHSFAPVRGIRLLGRRARRKLHFRCFNQALPPTGWPSATHSPFPRISARDWRRMTEGEGKRVPMEIRLVFANRFPRRQGDNCLLTRASRYVELVFFHPASVTSSLTRRTATAAI